MLFHAHVPPQFWPDALATSIYLLNRRPCSPRNHATPYALLFGCAPSYDHLRVFGYRCYPNVASTAQLKLAPCSVASVFLGYPADTKGYRCYNPDTRRVITTRHVHFSEDVFPFKLLSGSSPELDQAVTPVQDVLLVPVPAPRLHHQRRHEATQPRPTATPAPDGPAVDPGAPSPPTSGASAATASPGGRASSSAPEQPVQPASAPTPRTSTPSTAPAPSAPPGDPASALAPAQPAPAAPTRAQHGIHRPQTSYGYTATATSPSAPPTSVRAAMHDPEWLAAMQEEYNALMHNRTWSLIPHPEGAHAITGKWLFKNKLNPDGSQERRKARWVVHGFNQRAGVDFNQTFSPVFKPGSIRTVLHRAASRDWPVHQFDVKNAFLHGDLSERVLFYQPAGFIDPERLDHVCLLPSHCTG